MKCPFCQNELSKDSVYYYEHPYTLQCVFDRQKLHVGHLNQLQQALSAARADGERCGMVNVVSYIETWEPLLLSFYDDAERETFERLKAEMLDNTRHYFSMQPPA